MFYIGLDKTATKHVKIKIVKILDEYYFNSETWLRVYTEQNKTIHIRKTALLIY